MTQHVGIITLGSMPYTVELVPGLTMDDESIAGLVRTRQLSIQIEQTDPLLSMFSTLWHEILHALAFQAGHEVPEGLTNMFAYGVAGALLENPQISDPAYLLVAA